MMASVRTISGLTLAMSLYLSSAVESTVEVPRKQNTFTAKSSRVSTVLELNRFIFKGNVLSSREDPHVVHWIVNFCVPWFEKCMDISTAFENFGKEWQGRLNNNLFNSEIRFATVDCSTDKELCNGQGVNTYPSVAHYTGGVMVSKFEGGSRKDKRLLAKWLSKENLESRSAGAPADSAKRQGTLAKYVFLSDTALDIILALIGMAASFWLVLSNPALWQKGEPMQCLYKAISAAPSPEPSSTMEEVQPQERVHNRRSIEL